MQITSPTPGTAVSGKVTIKVDAPGIQKMNFYVDGVLKGRDLSTPFTFDWYTTNYSDGQHTIKAVSSNGRSKTEATFSVSNVMPASISINLTGTPQEGEILTATIAAK